MGSLMHHELHISSLVVQVLPSKARFVRRAIGRIRGAEAHAVSAEGRIIVTLEAESEADFMMRFSEIDQLSGVVSTMLVFHQVESLGFG
jgi:nitrate reductase NapD